ncbi:MAG TPA: hypothetical protein GXZ56_10845 [Bacteroidales bacterium]|nr:hypothetical protein [Bacteroidales bacterium]
MLRIVLFIKRVALGIGFCLVFAFCANPDQVETEDPNDIWEPDGRGWVANTWKSDGKGWILMENNRKELKRFFAIGTWHVPGYTFSNTAHKDSVVYRENEQLFKEKIAPFNMVFVGPGLGKEYMSEVIHVMNPFSATLHEYLDGIATLPKGDDKDYYRSQFLKQEVKNPGFVAYLDAQMRKILKTKTNDQYIFSHIDEIAAGGVSNWSIPPEAGALINERLKQADPKALVFVDLVGHAKGTTYLFERKYLETHAAMPEDPPYDMLSSDARACKLPLLGFYQAFDGSPVYHFKGGNYSYVEYDFNELSRLWVENLRILANAYKENGDVFGINAFRDFYAHPVLAGITVDAMREGLGEGVPIWLYFDGNGYAKPGNVSPSAYLKNVKCQIYTAIVHGVTGILFWNDWRKTPEVFDKLIPMMHELNDNLEVVTYDTVEKRIEGNLHVAVKKAPDGKEYYIATNSSKTTDAMFTLSGGNRVKLDPLGVYVSPK